MPKMRFEVSIDVPNHSELTREEVATYILDAIRCWKGQENSDGPRFELDRKRMTVKDPYKRVRYYDDD